MSQSLPMLGVDEAIGIIDSTPVHPRRIRVSLGEAAGLWLAEDLRADRDFPDFDRCVMDGFAVRGEDVASVPVTLRLVGEVAAGSEATSRVNAGQAMAIMTGGPLPPGADTVVPVEDVEGGWDALDRGTGTVRILRPVKTGANIAPRGTEATAGSVVLPAGTRLGAAQLAVAAAVGAIQLDVYAAPVVGVLATGNEIVSPDRRPPPAHVRNSNSVMLAALLRRLGCRPVDLGLVGDDRELLVQALGEGIRLDALMVSGGMSMGRYDLIPRLLNELGADVKIAKLRIKPGKPFIYALVPRPAGREDAAGAHCCHVFGLPGNPVSAFVCTVVLAARLLRRLAGGGASERWLNGELTAPLPPNGPREFYQPVGLDDAEGKLRVRPLPWRGSADLFTLAQAQGLLRRPASQPALETGASVRVMEV